SDTIGAPHSTTAATACSTGIRCLSTVCGCWLFPQPTHLRLHANSGSTSTIIGNFSTPRSFIFIRCVPSLTDRCSGKPMVYPVPYVVFATYSLYGRQYMYDAHPSR